MVEYRTCKTCASDGYLRSTLSEARPKRPEKSHRLAPSDLEQYLKHNEQQDTLYEAG